MVKQKDYHHLQGVFKSSVRILFEVWQATMMNWTCPPPEEGGSQYLYVVVSLNTKAKVGCRCRFLKSKKSKRGKAFQRERTKTMGEEDTVRWRKLNEEQSVLALFRLGHQKLKVNEGDQVNLIAEVFRTRTDDWHTHGTKVAVMQGSFKAGVLGQVTLWSTERKSEEHEDELERIPHLVLDLRPTCSSSFSLEHAQPRNKQDTIESLRADLAIQKNTFRRMNNIRRLSAMMNSSRRMSLGGYNSEAPDSSNITRKASDGCKTNDASLSMPLKRVSSSRHEKRSTPTQQPWSMLSSGGSEGTISSQSNSMRSEKEKGGIYQVFRRSGRSSVKSTATQNHASESRPFRQVRISGYHTHELHESGSGSRGSEGSALNMGNEASIMPSSSEKKTSRFGMLKALFKKNPQMELRQYDTWNVNDWIATWKSPWPYDSDDLKCKYDVVQLMQEEFRRDCVLFFNTLFPICFASYSMKSEGFGPLNQGFLSIREVALSRSTKTKIKRPPPEPKSFGMQSVLSLPASSSNKMLRALMPTKELDDVDGEVDAEVEVEVVSTIRFRCAPTGRSNQSSKLQFPKMFSERPAYRRYLLGPEPDANGYCPKGTGNAELLVSLLDDYSPRMWFLKRLYICFAVCGLYYTENGNSAQIGDLWPYPLASALGHGSRILIRLEDVDGCELLNFLLTGDHQKVTWKINDTPPLPLKARAAATHACLLETETGHVLEKKLHVANVADTFQNVLDGIGKKHLGLNIPMGGVGHPAPMGDGYVLGFTGRIYHDLTGVSKKRRMNCFGRMFQKKDKVFLPSQSFCSTATGNHFGTLSHSTGGTAGSDADAENEPEACAANSLQKSLKSERTCDHDGGDTEEKRLNWRSVPKRQSGHMYIRIDDFGKQTLRNCTEEDCLKETTIKNIREKPLREKPLLEKAITRRTIESHRWRAQWRALGEVFFPDCIPILPHSNSREHTPGNGHHASEGDFHRLVRVSSEPSLQTYAGVDASEEDIGWVKRMLQSSKVDMIKSGTQGTPPVYLDPPSASALRLLLHHFNPLGTHLFGTSHFKSVEDLFNEVSAQKSCMFIDKNGALQRFVESVVLQLRFRGRLLMLTHEEIEGHEAKLKNGFISTQLAEDEDWKVALREVLIEKLGLNFTLLLENLEGFSRDFKNSHSVIVEAMCSPSFPGLMCHYRTHMVHWDISEECDLEFFQSHGLPFSLKKRKSLRFNCDFTTQLRKDISRTKRNGKLYWAWVPEVEARKLQLWVNLGEANADERWARHAFQREGAVQFPPTEKALTILLQRCGIDVSRFGSGSRSLTALWRELTNQEGILLMHGNQPLLAVETILLMVRWKRKGEEPYTHRKGDEEHFEIMVQKREEHPDGRVNDTQKLLGGRKSKEISWSHAAVRCMMERLQLTRQQVTSILAHRPDDASEYTFVEERQDASTFPGIDMLHRTHLVTYTLKEDVHQTSAGRKVLGLTKASVIHVGIGSMSVAAPSRDDLESDDDEIPTERTVEVHVDTPYGLRLMEYRWMHTSEVKLEQETQGMHLFTMANKNREERQVSSVLLGLEGADPGNVSAFGCGHGADGQPSKISASGGRKWRAFRTNNAPQIPADIGGMRMKITRRLFFDLIETCQQLDLLDPGLDLLWEPFESYPRELLNHKYAERELFKRVLGGNSFQAKQAIGCMKEYRAKYKTLKQVHQTLHPGEKSVLKRIKPLARQSMLGSRESSLHSLGSTSTSLCPPSPHKQYENKSYTSLPRDDPLLPCTPLSNAQFVPSLPSQSSGVRSMPAGKILPHHPLPTPYVAPSYRKAKDEKRSG